MAKERINGLAGRLPLALLALAAMLLMALLAAGSKAYGAPPSDVYQLEWADEFDDGSVDADEWLYRQGNRVICANLPENVTEREGFLRIALKQETAGSMNYTCGGVISKRLFGYGYYETKAKLWPDKGFHSSFWLMGVPFNTADYSGPNNQVNEIDGFEVDGHAPGEVYTNTHYYTPSHVIHKGGVYKKINTAADYHVYGWEWTPTQVKFYVDGVLTNTVDYPGPHGTQNVWLTSLGYTEPVDATNLPGEVTYDYFRFYKKTDLLQAPYGAIIRDNAQPGYSESGGWSGTKLAYGFNDKDTRYTDAAGSWAQWDAALPYAGQYEVFAWNPSFYSSSDSHAVYTVSHEAGTVAAAVYVDQSTAGQQWVSLGTYSFAGSGNEYVRVSKDSAAAGSLRADAVMFVPAAVMPETPADAVPPAAPAGFTGTASLSPADGDAIATWTWTANSEPDIAGYNVYLDGIKMNWNLVAGTSFSFNRMRAGQGHTLTMSAVDHSGNESAPSGPAAVQIPADTYAPAAPGPFSVETSDGLAVLNWIKNTELDVRGYNVYLNNVKINTSPVSGGELYPDAQYMVKDLENGNIYTFHITAVDYYGNESAGSAAVTEVLRPITVIDGTGSGYMELSGSWSGSGIKGWANTSTRTSNTAGAAAVWIPALAASGDYEVFVWIPKHSNATVNAKYTVYYNGGSQEIFKNQTVEGNQWISLGTYPFLAGAGGYVKVENAAGSYLRTDAMRFMPAFETVHVIDGGDPGYSESGNWQGSGLSGYNGSFTRYAGAGGSYAQWTPGIGAPGNYSVYFYKVVGPSSHTNAQVSVSYRGVTDSRSMNLTEGASGWVYLGDYSLTPGDYVRIAKTESGGYVRSDAVKFVLNPSELYVDTESAGQYTESGNWQGSSLKGYNGSKTRFSSSSGAYARWTPDVPTAGLYEIYIYKVVGQGNAVSAQIDVHYTGGADTKPLYPADGVSGWEYVGDYWLSPGTADYIRLTKTVSGYIRSNAVRLIHK
ncbi:family 16 glycosylhydrolase [Paenibacillus sp. YN15]|uniref:golvesin C-terminal-like domain-containing protein n=1 Tax=Paenibacillus sp. YN15 TaxID=1742774 RepID=UPI000DCB102B|nr:family 16 glycosylhydrolase [Paenibacillus sp. YN15]RAU93705.1 hypothetical protein DQG13_25285 [Paenibacillus sp. YN15]